MCFGSVHAAHTSARGASIVRVSVTSRVIGCVSDAVVMANSSVLERMPSGSLLGNGFQLGEAGFEVAADHLVHVEEHMENLRPIRRIAGFMNETTNDGKNFQHGL